MATAGGKGAGMQPLIAAEQVRQGVADFLATTFSATTSGFEILMADFLATPGKLAQGPYVSIDLPFRKYAGKRGIKAILIYPMNNVVGLHI